MVSVFSVLTTAGIGGAAVMNDNKCILFEESAIRLKNLLKIVKLNLMFDVPFSFLAVQIYSP